MYATCGKHLTELITLKLLFLEKYIENFDAEHFEKWVKYFQLKHKFYLAYAYAYLAEQMLAEGYIFICGRYLIVFLI